MDRLVFEALTAGLQDLINAALQWHACFGYSGQELTTAIPLLSFCPEYSIIRVLMTNKCFSYAPLFFPCHRTCAQPGMPLLWLTLVEAKIAISPRCVPAFQTITLPGLTWWISLSTPQRAKPDMIAFKELRESWTPNLSHGHIPGVPVGMELLGRGEVAILGVHSKMMAGIDSR